MKKKKFSTRLADIKLKQKAEGHKVERRGKLKNFTVKCILITLLSLFLVSFYFSEKFKWECRASGGIPMDTVGTCVSLEKM